LGQMKHPVGRPSASKDATQCPSRVKSYRNGLSALHPLFPVSDHIADAPACRKSADTVAKLPKCHAINFPQIDQTSRNCRPMSLPARYPQRIIWSRRLRPGKFVLVDAKKALAAVSVNDRTCGLIARALECRQTAADPDALFSARRTLLSQIDACASLFADGDDLPR
jgi:hypothetical protein